MNRDDALAFLAGFAPVRWPGADTVLLCGSTAAGNATPNSDLDVVVLFERLPNAYRETIDADGTLVESFVHDPATLRWFFDDDGAAGQGTLAAMIAQGLPISGFPGRLLDAVKRTVNDIIAKGPPRWSADAIDLRRYLISSMADDFVADMPVAERIATAAELHGALAEFALRAAGRFSGKGKGLARALRRHDPALSQALADAVRDVVETGRAERLSLMVDAVLAPYGGRLMAGYRADAPADWRKD